MHNEVSVEPGPRIGESGSPLTIMPINRLSRDDLWNALVAGWADYKAAPMFGALFGLVYAAGGLALYLGLIRAGDPFWFAMAVAGFPLLAPFAAAGLYEVSRRREAGEHVGWAPVLGALRGHGDGQLAMMAVVVLVIFGFWLIMARGLFAIFLGQPGSGINSLEVLTTTPGIGLLLVGGFVGGLMAMALFAITAFSMPMLLHRPVDFVTAIITSLAVVRANLDVMIVWGLTIVLMLAAAMLPAFLGLLVVLPVLGHATWHLYRRAVAIS